MGTWTRFYRSSLIVGAMAGLLACFTGCQEVSTVKIGKMKADFCQFMQSDPNDPNLPCLQATGKAADVIAGQIAQNMQTAQGRLNEMVKYNAWLYVAFVIMGVLGIAFWAFTKSRYGWIPVVAAGCGIAFITFWAQYAKPASLIIFTLVGVLVIWKAVEYRNERNANAKRLENNT